MAGGWHLHKALTGGAGECVGGKLCVAGAGALRSSFVHGMAAMDSSRDFVKDVKRVVIKVCRGGVNSHSCFGFSP